MRNDVPQGLNKSTILLVDDDLMVLKMLKSYLESQDYAVVCASGGREALMLIEQQQQVVELLITDIRMPEMDGVQLMEAVRQLLPTLPMILMTGYSDFDLVVLGLKQHAFDLLFKPIDFDQLNWCITKALALKMVQRLEQQYTARLEEQVSQQTNLLCRQLEELHAAELRLSEVDQLKQDLLRLISHEFSTPQQGMLGAIQLIEETAHPLTHNDYWELLKASAQRIANLTNNLLTLVEVQGCNRLNDQVETICGTLETLQLRYSKMASGAGIFFQSHCNIPSDLKLDGSLGALQIITDCLLENAFKFTERGGEVTCRIWPENDTTTNQIRVMIQVSDNGCGIPLSLQKLLFQPLTRLNHNPAHRDGGIGIGLTIVRTICDRLDGSLTLESSPDKGSSFTCSLPFHPARTAQS